MLLGRRSSDTPIDLLTLLLNTYLDAGKPLEPNSPNVLLETEHAKFLC
jgi:hypothetical protein